MARNEEKHYGRLNRLLLQKERDEYLERHPKRPRLDSLHTTEEIIQWIPSIKADMNFYLKQTQVTCYCDKKVTELMEKVNQFEKEYKTFLRRARQLSTKGLDVAPWTPRSYKSKIDDPPLPLDEEKKAFTPIFTPILELTPPVEKCQPYGLDNLPLSNKPLQFNNLVRKNEEPAKCNGESRCESSGNLDCFSRNLEDDFKSPDASVSMESFSISRMSHSSGGIFTSDNTSSDHLCSSNQSSECNESLSERFVEIQNRNVKPFNSENCSSVFCDSAYHSAASKNILGLDYDSSSEDDSENT